MHENIYREREKKKHDKATTISYHHNKKANKSLTSGSSSVSSSSTTSALYSKSKSLTGFESSVQLINGCRSKSSQFGLFCGSLISAFAMKSMNSFDHFEGCSSLGGSDFWIFNSTRIGDISWLGGSIWANSISVIPIDQMSTLKS